MTAEWFSQKHLPFRYYIFVSIALHVSVVLFHVIQVNLFPSEVIDLQDSIRVDMVAMPDLITEQVEPEPTPEPLPVTEKKSPAIEKPKSNTKELQRAALEKIQAQTALEKIKQEVKARQDKPTAEKPPEPTVNKPTYKGNVISSGNAFTGVARLRVNEYLLTLTRKVRAQFFVPEWMDDETLRASVVIELDRMGNLVKRTLTVSSGNSVFDSACLTAVENANPFPAPPSEAEGAQILLRFPFE
jgi:TonB family protein